MNISIIFPTYQRANDLKIALDSLLEQTLFPIEVIVVDQSEDEETNKLCKDWKYEKLNIRYIFIKIKSSTIARQVWMESLSKESEIMIFFDDDVKLDMKYLEEVSNFIQNNQKALWWWGQILNLPIKKNLTNDIWNLIFRNEKISHEFCTTNAQYKDSNNIQNVSSIIWCNMFFRSSLSKEFSFESWMKKCWDADDTFFSYSIQNKYPNSLFYIPTARLYHFESPAWRMIKLEKFNQILYHRFIFWKKYNFSMITYYWWTLWFLIWTLLQSDNKMKVINEYFKTHFNIFKYSKEIQRNPEKVNDFIYK